MWKGIKGYEGLYEVNDNGDVKSLCRYKKNHSKMQKIEEKIMKKFKKNNGYIVVNLWKENKGKSFYVHRLVADTFIENTDNKKTVNHKDFNKENNKVENLEWLTQKENNLHAVPNRKFKRNLNIIAIKNGEKEIITNLLKWCKENKKDRTAIYKVLNKKQSHHHGYYFEFIK